MTTPFDPTRCGIPPVPDIDSVEGIEDCFISPAPPPITDCQSPIFPPTDALLNNPPEFNPIDIEPPVPVLPPTITIIPEPPWPQPQIPWLKFPIFKLIECRGKEEVYTFQWVFAFFLWSIIRYKGKCWKVSVEEFGGQQPVVEIPKLSVYKNCDECGSCWQVYKCSDGSTLTVRANLGEVFRKGKIVRFDFDTTDCYVPIKQVPCKGQFKKAEVTQVYDSCQYCKHIYELVNCENPSDKIFTHQPLSYYLNVTPEFLIQNEITFQYEGFCYKTSQYIPAPTNVKYVEVDYLTHKQGCDECEPKCFEIYPCSSGDSIYTDSARMVYTGDVVNLAGMRGKIVQLDGSNKCYVVGNEVDCKQHSTKKISVIGMYDSCGDCLCYKLTRCADDYSFVACGDAKRRLQLGKVYTADDSLSPGDCYEVTDYVDPDTANPEKLIYNVSESIFQSCDECAQQGTGNYKYRLHPICFDDDCEETPNLSSIVTEESLGMLVGGYISFDGICWYVEQVDPSTPTDRASILYEGPFENCDDCLQNSKNSPSRYVESACHDGSGNLEYVERIMYVPVDPCGRRNVVNNPPCDGSSGVQSSKFEDCDNQGTFIYLALTSGLTTNKVYKLSDGTCWTYRGDDSQVANDNRTVNTTPAYDDCSQCKGSSGGGSGVACAGCNDIPATLTASFSDPTGGDCTCLDGVQITLTYDANTADWRGSTTACGATVQVRIFCDGGSSLIFAIDCGGGESANAITIQQCNGSFQGTTTVGDSYCCADMAGNPITVDVTITG